MAALSLPARILVVDDFEAWRRLLCSMIRSSPDLHLVGEASDGEEAIELAERLKPDLVLLDIGLPKLSGIAAGRLIRKCAPRCKILFLTLECDADLAMHAREMGAHGCLRKSVVRNQLIAAVQSAIANRHLAG